MTGTDAEPSIQERREQQLVDAVVASLANTPDERLRTVLTALVEHLHAFIREVRLTGREWQLGIDFLTRVGHITDDKRQEFILLSDVLGASMQTITVNDDPTGRATEATVVGPFFVEDSPLRRAGRRHLRRRLRRAVLGRGQRRGCCWSAAPGARIEVWEADDHGYYDVQYTDGRTAARGHLFADDEGRYRFWALTPTPYPIPADGPVGDLLAAARTAHPCGRRTCTSWSATRACAPS